MPFIWHKMAWKKLADFEHTTCKGKSFNPLCYYSYLIADLAVLKWNIVCIFCSIPAPCLKAFALSGRDCSNTRYPGCRFACPAMGSIGLLLTSSAAAQQFKQAWLHSPCTMIQPALAESETWVSRYSKHAAAAGYKPAPQLGRQITVWKPRRNVSECSK